MVHNSCQLNTVGFNGINVYDVKVEISLIPGIPKFKIVGLGDKSIVESQHRISCALYSLGLKLPAAQIIVNLSPADVEKYGTHYDLPITLGIISLLKKIQLPQDAIIAGEVGLDGKLSPIKGIIPICSYVMSQDKLLITNRQHYKEIAMVGNRKNIVAFSLDELIENITNKKYECFSYSNPIARQNNYCFDHVFGQNLAKRALTISIAGKHHMLMIGSHGVGKSTLAKIAHNMTPQLTKQESIETTSIYNMIQPINNLINYPPIRDPHSSLSSVAMIGGGSNPKPGEISLAHNGILFLDELPEFKILDTLRTPLEDGYINVSRIKYNVNFPARFQLLASMNPCKCGLLPSEGCRCKNNKYMDKVSKPILDRIAIHITLLKEPYHNKNTFPNMQNKIDLAIDRQRHRGKYNGFCSDTQHFLTDGLRDYMYGEVMNKLQLTMRQVNNITALAKTIADMENLDSIEVEHLQEAILLNNSSVNCTNI